MKAGSQQEMQRRLIPDPPRPVRSGAGEEPAEKWNERLRARITGMRRKAATAVLIAFSVGLAAYAIFGHDGLVAYQHKQRQAAQLQQQIQNMQKENERMALHNQRLTNDRDTIEYEAREQMHYTRPGEVIYTLPVAPGSSQHK